MNPECWKFKIMEPIRQSEYIAIQKLQERNMFLFLVGSEVKTEYFLNEVISLPIFIECVLFEIFRCES